MKYEKDIKRVVSFLSGRMGVSQEEWEKHQNRIYQDTKDFIQRNKLFDSNNGQI